MSSPLKFDCLPAEILSHIRLLQHTDSDPFKLISSDEEEESESPSPQSQCQLQLVNRRFRQLELNLPELWAYVDVESMNADQIQLQLQRSKKVGVTLDLSIGRTSSRNREFLHCMCDRLAIIKDYAHRWTRCVVGVHDVLRVPDDSAAGGEHRCFDTLQDIRFPSTTHLVFDYVEDEAEIVIKTWSFDNLKYLRNGRIEGVANYLPFITALDTLSFQFESLSFGESSFKKAIEPFALNLRCLHIDWFNVHCSEKPGNCITLPSLQEFTLIDKDPIDDPVRILELFQRVSMPALVRLSLEIHVSMCCTHNFLPWLRSLKNPELKNVDVVVTQAKNYAQRRTTIGKIFVGGARPEDLVVNVTMEDDPEDVEEEEEEEEPL